MLVLLLVYLLPPLRRKLALELRDLIVPSSDIQSNRSPEDTLLPNSLAAIQKLINLTFGRVGRVSTYAKKNRIMRKLTSYAQNKILPYLR